MIKNLFRRKKRNKDDYNSCCAAHMRSVAVAIELAQQGIVLNNYPYLADKLVSIARTSVQYRRLTDPAMKHEGPFVAVSK
jgi:hypothetical protein